MQRSEERRGTRQIALGLCDSGLGREGIEVIRRNIENLIKLSQCFGKAPECIIGNGVLSEWGNVARVEPFGFVEIRLAPVPLASPPRDIGQRLRNPAVIGRKLTRLLKVMHRGVVIRRTDNVPWPIWPRRDWAEE